MNDIQFVYFDVGGVLIRDYSGTDNWTQMKRDLGIEKDQDAAFDDVWKQYEGEVCTGRDVETLIPKIEEGSGIKIPKAYSLLQDFVHRFGLNQSIWSVAAKAKKQYKVGLLTNMYPRMLPAIKKRELLPDLSWNVVIDSSLVNTQKPEDAIFEIAQRRSGVDPRTIFFVDNSPQNIEVAKTRGWQTFLYDPKNPEKSSRELAEILELT